ncbi:hypothetical protein VTN96DRAFT_8383 [Rasamsonia emersonii]
MEPLQSSTQSTTLAFQCAHQDRQFRSATPPREANVRPHPEDQLATPKARSEREWFQKQKKNAADAITTLKEYTLASPLRWASKISQRHPLYRSKIVVGAR